MQRGNRLSYPSIKGSLSKPHRETGIISKIMTSYGFISCCERNESIFFHFSQFNGDPGDLTAGDEVEFEVDTDTSKGKLIARRIVCLPTGTVSFESVGEERLLGKVDLEPQFVRVSPYKLGRKDDLDSGLGRIVYERNGEFFFILYGFTDVNDDREIHTGDEVSFYMATNKRTGALRARLVRLVQPAKVEKTRGLIKSLKESFGFIERADVVDDIFFHYSEVDPGEDTKLILGASVEFIIHNRQGKDVATQIKVLPHGTVTFDDVGSNFHNGVIRTPVIRSFTHGRGKECEATSGEIIYQSTLGDPILAYTERDQEGSYTMLTGDIVKFKLATDKRDGSRRATKVSLVKLMETHQGHNTREKGVIAALRDGFGFIRCANRDARMFFHFNEVIDSEADLTNTTEVEFTVQQDYTNERLHAVRIIVLPPQSVQFEVIKNEIFSGRISEELPHEYSKNKPNILKLQKDSPCGIIQYILNDQVTSVAYYWTFEPVQFGDQVKFQIAERSYDHMLYAVNINVVLKARDIRFKGFVSVLKEGFGFIETEEHDCELFFPFSSCNKYCDPRDLKLMDEVEYGLIRKNERLSADEIKKLEHGTITPETIQPGSFEGTIIRPMKSSDQPDQYEGLIQPTNSNNDVLPYSFTSLTNHRIQLQAGEQVNFQLGLNPSTGTVRAMNIVSKRELLRGTIESIKDQYGFINYKEGGATQSVFFHMNSMSDECGFSELSSGDEVEFMTIFSNKSKKDSAIYVRKLSMSARPTRLLPQSDSLKPVPVLVIRQPKGPDNTTGFIILTNGHTHNK